MTTFSVRLFGKFCAQRDEQVIDSLDMRKSKDLFCYLALNRDQPHARESVAGLLWGNTTTAQSKAYLRKALWQLQEALHDPTAPAGQHILLVDSEWIQLNPKANLWLDIEVFEQAFNQAQGIAGHQISADCAQALRSAIDLYRGELLEGCYQDWCLYERERLQNIYLAILDKLMGYCEAQQEYEHGLVYGARILRYDRAREQTHRRLMRLHALAGDRSAALRQYEHCVAALQDELNVAPTPYTIALFDQIRTNQLDGIPRSPLAHPASPTLDPPLTGILHNLKQLQNTVVDIQRQIQSTIHVIEKALLGQHK